MKLFALTRLFLALSIAVAGAGCAAQTNTAFPLPQSAAIPAFVQVESAPPHCKGQMDARDYALVTKRLSSKGASLCIPKFDGLGGALPYPDVKPAVVVNLISTNVDFNGFPHPGHGSPIDYLQLRTFGSPAFGKKLRAGSGLTGKAVKSKSAYTAFSSYFHLGLWRSLSSCYAVAKPGPHGGVIEGLGSLLKGRTIPGTMFLIEVFPGRQTGTKC